MIALDEGEIILRTVRRHWWIFLTEILVFIVLTSLPFFFFEATQLLLGGILVTEGELLYHFIFFTAVWELGIWVIFFVIWTNYYLDLWIVTNKRLIDVEQVSLFHREISTFRLDRVQDITVKISGLLGTFLKFGNVIVQTASEQKAFTILGAYNPEEVKQIIQDAHDRSIEIVRNI